jgi:single-strand DNA-binding protein
MFIGRLGGDPTIRYTPDGNMVTSFSIACDESYKNKSGEKVSKTEWVKVVTWRKLAEICGNYLQKGSLVFIEGKMQTRSWEDKDGVKRYTTEILGNVMKMLGGKSEGRDNGVDRDLEAGGWSDPDPDGDVPF